MRSALALMVVVLIGVAAAAQTPPRDQPRVAVVGSAVVTGTVVVDDETRAPLRHATVGLSRSAVEDIRTTTTDDQGRYLFDHLPAGSYALSAGKGAYLGMTYGAPKPGMPGSSVVLAEGEAFTAKPIALWRGAVIAGRLFDRAGQPVSGAVVEANQFVVVNGSRRRRAASRPSQNLTNAHGEYRIYGLLPGEYLVSSAPPPQAVQADVNPAEFAWASSGAGQPPPPARAFTYAPTMFPGTTNASAGAVITLGRGEERLGVDFSLQFVPVARVSGIVIGPDGQPASGVLVLCATKDANPMLPPSGVPISRPSADGSFACSQLTPGQYTLAARGAGTLSSAEAARVNVGLSPPPLWGLVDVAVAGKDLSNVVIRLQPGVSVTGQVVLARAASSAGAELTRFQMQMTPAAGAPPIDGRASAPVGADGTFRIESVVPASYRFTAATPAGWFLRSATLGEKDLADVPFEVAPGQNVSGLVVTFTDVQTELSGALTDREGRPAPQLYVFVYPTDKALWVPDSRRIRSVRSGENGSYLIAGLPAGDYYLCALTELDTALQFEPEYLEPFIPSAIKITLGEGEKRKQDLRIGG